MSCKALQPSLLLLLCLVAGCLPHSTSAVNCPARCSCVWLLDSLEVNCARRALSQYPHLEAIPVEHLDLSHNNLTEFPRQYADIDSLIHLDLSGNRIEFIDKEDLMGFTSLRTLLLANNSIISWAHISPSEAFQYATNLKTLSLSGNHLGSFVFEDESTQLRSQSLSQLELVGCAIASIGGDQLMQSLPNLERLILNNNRLTSVAAMPSRSLRALDLGNCSLQRISAPLLQGLPSLEALNLAWNTALQFSSDLAGTPISAYTLNYLDLSYCNLDEINLSGLPSLAALRLRGNMLRTINAQMFANNSLVEVLDLSRNALRVIEGSAFSALKRLTRLDLAYNEIAYLDRNVFRGNDVLVALNLSRNVFDRFTKIVSNSLREINLSWCEITTVESTALTGLSTLQRLDLSHNLLRDIPNLMRSETLQTLDLSNCRLTAVRNNTFRDFPELANLYLNGNRFTNPISTKYFRSNRYLDQIWLGDNPWICNCDDPIFIEFYDFLTSKPQKVKDKQNLRCASPAVYYGKTWELACLHLWEPNARSSSGDTVWTTILMVLVLLSVVLFSYVCLKRYLKDRKHRNDQLEFDSNQEELQQMCVERERDRRLNQRLLQEEASSNAPSIYETNLPSYEDALRMPKLVRPVKSMGDLTAPERSRKRLRRSQTENDDDAFGEQSDQDNELQLDTRQRFRSVEMLSNRDKERTVPYGPYRRTGRVDYNNSGSRRFSIENSRFPAAHLKSQNLQSAEQISNFQSYENSPYTKRKPKIAEIPPFRRANMMANSVEFLTDPEYDEVQSKPNSPFAKRKPKPSSQTIAQVYSLQQQTPHAQQLPLAPAVEDYFSAAQQKQGSSSEGSDFQLIIDPDLASLRHEEENDTHRSNVSTSDTEADLERGKRKKRKNSVNRRVSGNFSAAAAAADNDSSSSDREPIVLVHKPMRETLF